MPPQRKDLIRDYYQYDLSTNQSTCCINVQDLVGLNHGIEENSDARCLKIIQGQKVSNLKSHLKNVHPKVFENFVKRESKSTMKRKHTSSNDDPTLFDPPNLLNRARGKITDHYEKSCEVVQIPVTKAMVRMWALRSVTLDGRPLSSIHDSGPLIFAQPAMDKLRIHFNRHNIKDLIKLAAQEVRLKIAQVTHNSLVSVKVDCATRMNRAFLGMNIQVNHNGKILTFTLAAHELKERHTGENLKRVIFSLLKPYNISEEHIYTVTTDNGKNLVKAVSLMDNAVMSLNTHSTASTHVEDDPYDDNFYDYFDDPHFANGGEAFEDPLTITDFPVATELLDAEILANEISHSLSKDQLIFNILCAAHTIKLAVEDSLKNSWGDAIQDTYLDVICKSRDVVKHLRSQTIVTTLREKKLSIPPLDVKTRWGSTYMMLTALVKLKSYCAECYKFGNTRVYLSEKDWNDINEIIMCLQPAFKASKKLQDENLTLSDVYKIINICHMDTAAIGTNFSQTIVDHLLMRRAAILDNTVMLAAIYLDPRFSFELTDEQREQAIAHILLIYKRCQECSEESDMNGKPDVESTLPSTHSDTDSLKSDDDDDVRYDKQLKMKHKRMISSKSSLPLFEAALRSFSQVERIPTGRSVLRFWEDNKIVYPLLYPIAKIILAVPGTQVSVERLFSQLRFILNELRERLNSSTLEDILLIRSNFNHLQEIFK